MNLNLKSKNIVIVGLGKSGAACARFLINNGAQVVVTDQRAETELGAFVEDMKNLGVKLELGGHPDNIFSSSDMIILSPGVPHTLPIFRPAAEKGVPIIGEIELASWFIKEPIIAVTGTNGKTTTTELISEMLKASGFKVFTGGNIGNPLIDYAANGHYAERVVVEVSSFQLDTIMKFHPHVAVLLNITPDHLDRYPDFAGYAQSKGRIFENQTSENAAIINNADQWACNITQNISSQKQFFSSLNNTAQALISENHVLINNNKINLEKAALTGMHNRENIAAAALATLAAGGTLDGIQKALDQFESRPHRLEYVSTINNVQYFDDSKATNTDAVARALESFKEPVILIMGGRGKGYDFNLLSDSIQQHVKKIIAIGETAGQICSDLGRFCPAIMADSMKTAVIQASEIAESGDVVLLSPACASFDMYTSYAQRGQDFCRVVQQLHP